MKKHETELDYLAPFLAQIGDPPQISRQEAFKLKEECLQDLKHRLIDKANLIQGRFEKAGACYRYLHLVLDYVHFLLFNDFVFSHSIYSILLASIYSSIHSLNQLPNNCFACFNNLSAI